MQATEGNPTATPEQGLIAYIDGFNLYHGLHTMSQRQHLWLDVVQLIKELRPRSTVLKVKYFTATVLDDPDAQSRQDHYIEALQNIHPGVLQVIRGKYQRKEMRCRACGAQWRSYEEKQTDVNIAIHLVADVAASRANTYLLITADTDIIPAIKMAQAQDSAATIVAQFPPRRESSAISRLLPSSRQITRAKIESALLPDTVSGRRGKVFSIPEKWGADQPVAETSSETDPVTPAEAQSCNHPTPRDIFGAAR